MKSDQHFPSPSPSTQAAGKTDLVVQEEFAFEVVSRKLFKDLLHAKEVSDQLQDQLLRVRAEFENFRKRQQKEREELLRYANESFLSDMLPLIDNLELGIKAAATAKDPKSITQGLEMVLGQLHRFLEQVGMKAIDATGKQFDSKLHEAMGQKPTSDFPEGTVVEQHRKGYTLHERLIRPASVVVAQAPSNSSDV